MPQFAPLLIRDLINLLTRSVISEIRQLKHNRRQIIHKIFILISASPFLLSLPHILKTHLPMVTSVAATNVASIWANKSRPDVLLLFDVDGTLTKARKVKPY